MDNPWDKWVTLNFVKLIQHLQQYNLLNLVFQNRLHSEEYKSLRFTSSGSCTEDDRSQILLSEILPKKGLQSFEFFDTICRLMILWPRPMRIFCRCLMGRLLPLTVSETNSVPLQRKRNRNRTISGKSETSGSLHQDSGPLEVVRRCDECLIQGKASS